MPYKDEERTLVSYVVRTTSLRGTEYEVPHSAPKFQAGVFDSQSISTVPDVQLIQRMTICDNNTLEKVEAALPRWLGLAHD